MKSIVAEWPWDHIAYDLFMPGPISVEGFNYVLVIVDICTHFVVLVPLWTKSAEEVALTFYNLFALLGFPKICQSDNGTEFDNQIIKALTDLAAIDCQLITPYHPQANGVTEQFVQTVQNVLKKMVEGNSHNWAAYIPAVQM